IWISALRLLIVRRALGRLGVHVLETATVRRRLDLVVERQVAGDEAPGVDFSVQELTSRSAEESKKRDSLDAPKYRNAGAFFFETAARIRRPSSSVSSATWGSCSARSSAYWTHRSPTTSGTSLPHCSAVPNGTGFCSLSRTASASVRHASSSSNLPWVSTFCS